MVLLSEVFHGRGESLNLSLDGSYAWFVSLNVVGGCHRVSEYHVTLCSKSVCIAYKSQSFLQTAPTNDVEKSPMSHTVRSQQHLHNKKKKDLTENTDVVLAKYLSKVKLESFHNSRVPELGSIMRTCSLRVFGFLYSSVEPKHICLRNKSFPYREDFY